VVGDVVGINNSSTAVGKIIELNIMLKNKATILSGSIKDAR
jgi:hypothetical protein